MRTRAWLAIALAACSLGAAEICAQASGPAQSSGQLDWLVGDWDLTWRYSTAGGTASRVGTLRSRWVFDGWLLLDELVERRADGSEIRTVIQRSRDAATGQWQVVSWELPLDEHPYLLDGTIDDDGVMRGAGGPVDSPVQLRYELQPGARQFTLTMDLSRDGGESWTEGAQVLTGRRR